MGLGVCALLQRVPPLLEACVCDKISVLRTLRLVSKESSHVALLGLRTYTLTLMGSTQDINMNGAVLLRTTRLDTLRVRLVLSGTVGLY